MLNNGNWSLDLEWIRINTLDLGSQDIESPEIHRRVQGLRRRENIRAEQLLKKNLGGGDFSLKKIGDEEVISNAI